MGADGPGGGRGLVGAMDLTGNPNDEQYTHLAIIVGREDYLQSVVASLECGKIHMRCMIWKDQRVVLHGLKLNSKDCVAACVRMDRNAAVDAVLKIRRVRMTRAARKKVLRAYHRRLLDQIIDLLKNFLAKHNVGLSDIIFQCDSDCVGFAKDVGLLYEDAGGADARRGGIRGLADAIAWANNRGREPKNVISKDAAGTIRRILVNEFARKRK